MYPVPMAAADHLGTQFYTPGANHAALLKDAVRTWTSNPGPIQEHIADIDRGHPGPTRGDLAVAHRSQSEALHHEMSHGSSPGPLYRGVRQNMGDKPLARSKEYEASDTPKSWTANRDIAQRFAGKVGYIREKPAGTPAVHVDAHLPEHARLEDEWIAR